MKKQQLFMRLGRGRSSGRGPTSTAGEGEDRARDAHVPKSAAVVLVAASVDSPARADEVTGEYIDLWNTTHANEETGEIPDKRARAAACRWRF